MTYDLGDLSSIESPNKKLVQTTNGELVLVEGAGTISIFPETCLKIFFYIHKLSDKLLSVSQLTKELKLYCFDGF